MIDWHTHILPGMDDGSRNVEESVAMMRAQTSQGVGTVIATPHFYANDEPVESFLDRRQKALEAFRAVWTEDEPEIRLGAEVRYYPGISHMPELKSLRIEGSKLLLLEMPMTGWTEYMVRELIELSRRSDIRIVMAHVERYMGIQDQRVWDRIYECGILAQVNASFFASFSTRRKALSLLKSGRIHFVGSDCHNTTSRPPELGRAFDTIRKKLGDDYVCRMTEYGYSLLVHANKNTISERKQQK